MFRNTTYLQSMVQMLLHVLDGDGSGLPGGHDNHGGRWHLGLEYLPHDMTHGRRVIHLSCDAKIPGAICVSVYFPSKIVRRSRKLARNLDSNFESKSAIKTKKLTWYFAFASFLNQLRLHRQFHDLVSRRVKIYHPISICYLIKVYIDRQWIARSFYIQPFF